MTTPPKPSPGAGFLGWLGRQVGHIRNAIHKDITAPKTVYRDTTVEEQPHPAEPNLILRRTTIDEVVEEKSEPPKEPRAT